MVDRREPLMSGPRIDQSSSEGADIIGGLGSVNFQKLNKAVRVNFSGGLLGLVFGSSRGKVDSVLQRQNADGWNLAEVIPDNPNLAIWIVRIFLLILTLGLWTLSNGYIFIFEKPRQ